MNDFNKEEWDLICKALFSLKQDLQMRYMREPNQQTREAIKSLIDKTDVTRSKAEQHT